MLIQGHKKEVRGCGNVKGSGSKEMSEMIPNDGGNRIGTEENKRDSTVHDLNFYPEKGGFVRKVCKFLQHDTLSRPGRPNCS